jgi:O-antigen ligase
MIEKLQRVMVTFILLVDMRVFHSLSRGETSDAANVEGSTDTFVLIIVALANLLVILLAMSKFRKMLSIFAHNLLICAMLAMVFLSVTWSLDRGFSFRRAVLLLFSTTLAVYLGQRFSVDDLHNIYRNTILVMFGLSALVLVVSPGVVLDPANPGAIRGLVGHKNGFGLYAGLLAVMLMAGGMTKWRNRAAKYLTFGIALGVVALSHSSTALIAFAAVAGMYPLLRSLQKRPEALLPKLALGFLLVAPIALMLATGSDSMFGSVTGKDASLSGRTKLWGLLVDAVSDQPMKGYGYDAYLGSQGSEWKHVAEKTGWTPAHAHNGYLQMTVSLGLPGLAIFMILLVLCVRRAMAFARENPSAEGLFPLAILLYLIVHNMSETTFLQSSGLVNILMFSLYVSMSLHPFLRSSESAEYEVVATEPEPAGNLPAPGMARFITE